MDQRTNRYKIACQRAARTARHATEGLTVPAGHPLDGTLSTLQDAWVSPSWQRQDYHAAIDGLSHRLAGAFGHAAADLTHAAATEPDTVDTDDPSQAWKAWFDTHGSSRSRAV